MKFTLNWLKKYIDTQATATEIANKLDLVGFEIDEVIESNLSDFVVAKIISCEPHPDSDHLHLLKVDDGVETLDIVCGAPNARTGLTSVLARVGTKIPSNDMIIKSGKIRGHISNGMMCSAEEIGAGSDNAGIMELDSKIKAGTKLSEIIKSETIFVGEITPNRPDYLSVFGIATDLIAAGLGTQTSEYKKVLALEENSKKYKNTSKKISIKNLAKSECPWYSGCLIEDVKNQTTPEPIKTWLSAIGFNPKSALVDLTNYICFDLAQPLHAFDADKIKGDIQIRMANLDEEFEALDGKTYKLSVKDLIIADDEGPIALAGIMGGVRTCSDENTKNLFLECAYFDPSGIRKTGRRLKIESDSRYRYERGINPLNQIGVLKLTRDLIIEICGGKASEILADGEITKQTIATYNPSDFQKKIGINLDSKTQKKILTNLNFEIDDSKPDWKIKVPGNKVDVTMNMDIIEEILRIHGYDNLQGVVDFDYEKIREDLEFATEEKIKILLTGRGISENISFSFTSSALEEQLIDSEPNKVLNPIVADLDIVRQTLITNLIQAVQLNQQMGNNNISLFEMGAIFMGKKPFDDKQSLAIIRTGLTEAKHWLGASRPVDVFDIKSDIFATLSHLGFNPNSLKLETENAPKWAHPYRFGNIVMGKKLIGTFGELHPAIQKKLKLKGPIVIGEINLYALPEIKKSVRKSLLILPELQTIKRDFAFILDKDIPATEVINRVYKLDSRIIDINVFDFFSDETIGKDKLSMAFSITIQPTEIMKDEEINAIQAKIISDIEKTFAGKIRDE